MRQTPAPWTGWDLPHHDGSPLYVPQPRLELGRATTLFLRAPRSSGVREAWVYVLNDGEGELVQAVLDRADDADAWFRADIRPLNPVLSYRWLLDGGRLGCRWLNASGLSHHDVPDAANFRLSVWDPPAPWASGTVYQVFPDRFAKSVERDAPSWALPAAWEDPVIGAGTDTPRQFYGGDLDGVAAHLDHIAGLGVGTIYLTPVFPAASNHRYDAATFSRVDPLLGGEAALARLAAAAHARGLRLLGDLTTNHCGATHEWFRAAVADPTAPEAGFFHFARHPDRYAGWRDLPSLPVFDHRSAELRRRLYDGPDSVVARWLGPHGFDGWRIDVANMTGRRGAVDRNHEVAAAIRRTMAAALPASYLVAESHFDASRDLYGDGFHATMNYAAFARPLWQWLAPEPLHPLGQGPWPALPVLPGGEMVAGMRALSGVVPWQATAHALNLIGSHDTTRVANLLGNPERVDVALGMLAAYPGVPMLYAGDELGLRADGPGGEYGRIPMPWDRPERWDRRRLDRTRALFNARAASPALRGGGLRWLAAGPDAVTLLREAPGESVLVHAARAGHTPVRLPRVAVGAALEGLAGTPDLVAVGGHVTLPAEGPAVGLWRVGGG